MQFMKVITCPNCGAEYLPAEIFYPDEFFGKPKKITKGKKGRIKFYQGDMVLDESYVCDYCGRKMHVVATIDFEVNVKTFDNKHVTHFHKSPLTMKED